MSITGMDTLIGGINRLINSNRSVGQAAATAHAQMAERIFNGGMDARGNLIGGGNYSPRYALLRSRAGRPTDKIYLRFTGAMERSWVLMLGPDGVWESGFISQDEGNKAEWNEERYEQRIFELSEQEEKAFVAEIERTISL